MFYAIIHLESRFNMEQNSNKGLIGLIVLLVILFIIVLSLYSKFSSICFT